MLEESNLRVFIFYQKNQLCFQSEKLSKVCVFKRQDASGNFCGTFV